MASSEFQATDISPDLKHDAQRELVESSQRATQREHDLTIRQALTKHRSAVFWAAYFILPGFVIGYDPTILGTLVGVPQFRKDFGYEHPVGSGNYVLSSSWTSAFPYAPIIGFLVAPLWAGWCVDRFGPRKTLLCCTTLSLGTLLMEVLGNSAGLIFAGDILTGLLTGGFPVLGPAYIGEILPVSLRGVGLAANNFAQVAGSFIAIGILRGTETRADKWAYKIPFITEYAFPVIFILGALFAPETPWFLVKKARYEEAEKSLKRTGYTEDLDDTLAHMKETILLGEQCTSSATYLDCFKGTNFRRTAICSICYSGQFFCGVNVVSSYATYFFQLAGVTTDQAFDLSLGMFALGIVGNIISWPLLSIWGRRLPYILTTCATGVLMFLIGFLDLAPSSNTPALYAKSSMLLVFFFIYNFGLGPLVYALIAEIPSTTIRGKTMGVACAFAHIFSLVLTAALPYAMSPLEADWGGKIGFLFGGLSIGVIIWACLCLPETKGRTFEELDILFERNTPAWKFASTDLTNFDRLDGTHGDQA
ncbi:Major facilitator superfamily domain general substrate transporter [Penicillium vulpinum]|uniref:Major facilitator superfamily domain general substrate transporter n=1 Tax=Penicillium vulpinum TaxID=29845 RepID=UPI00254992A1|nr:Major facilitator superfamily domain general substrate transporter [Penicillium vulpinum]KAJ5952235.1 Major facilitator superfamily domain general substrate transporter [Penicillium vulpinum]